MPYQRFVFLCYFATGFLIFIITIHNLYHCNIEEGNTAVFRTISLSILSNEHTNLYHNFRSCYLSKSRCQLWWRIHSRLCRVKESHRFSRRYMAYSSHCFHHFYATLTTGMWTINTWRLAWARYADRAFAFVVIKKHESPFKIFIKSH